LHIKARQSFAQLKAFWVRESFLPSYAFGLWINPFFIVRRGLFKGVKEISEHLRGGKLLDFGCGRKPYEKLFKVDEYIGVDVETSGHDHSASQVDYYYDGKNIPFPNGHFDNIFSSEVIEHISNLDDIFLELNRILSPGGKIGLTCPFIWDEHEQPFDYYRYTSYGIKELLEKHGFEIILYKKSGGYLETIFQLLSLYIWKCILPNSKILKVALTPALVAPINILGMAFGFVLPDNKDLFLNNIIVAKKL
jgi:SAM-dependent methyltransferase